MGALRSFLGLDLGQCLDYTAIVLLEWIAKTGEWDAANFVWQKITALRVRYVERMPRGTPYPEVVERMRRLVQKPELAGTCQLIVDATGVGQAVVDMLDRANLGCPIRRVKITGGDTERYADGSYRVPKQDLIARVQVLLQEGRLEIAKGIPHGETLVRELTEMRVKILPSGYEHLGSGREGEHDDLVLALAMAAWGAEKTYPGLMREAGYWRREREFYGPGRIG